MHYFACLPLRPGRFAGESAGVRSRLAHQE